MNTGTMLAITPPDFRSNTRRMSAIILAKFQPRIPVEYQENAGNNSVEFQPRILVEYRGNAGNNSGRILAHNSGGMPEE